MSNHRQPIAYVLKRYPRLTETFILNEIRAMERLGHRLEIFSLLPPEPPPYHSTVAEVRAPVTHLPVAWGAKLAAVARGHATTFAASPTRYAGALGHAVRRSLGPPAPLSVWRQFLRAGFFAAAARRLGVGQLHAHFANAPSAVAHFVNLMTGTPFSFTAHAKDIYLTPAHLIRERVAAAGFIATCTGYNADFLRALLPQAMRHKVNLVYHGIDLSLFRFRPPPYTFNATRKPLILCVARLVPKKGVDDLIAACAVLQRAGVRFRCEIVGDGPLRAEIENAISSAGLGEDVALLGPMTHARLIEHLGEADLFALAPCIAEDGDRDGIPNAIVEAMAIGVPVVSSDISGIPEMVMHEKSGLLVPPRDRAALAAAMARVLADPVLGRRLARTARARLDRCFNCWENTRELGGLMDRLACEAIPSCQRLSKRREPTGVERVL